MTSKGSAKPVLEELFAKLEAPISLDLDAEITRLMVATAPPVRAIRVAHSPR